MERTVLLLRATILSEYLRGGFIDEYALPEYDGKYKYFPSKEEFEEMPDSLIECYLDAYRDFLVNLIDNEPPITSAVVEEFKATFSHEVSFTCGSVD